MINVEGNVLQNVDYATRFARDIRVLKVGPALSLPVAEAALGAGARPRARASPPYDRRMREGAEEYGFKGNRDSFLLSFVTIGLIGFGNLGRALLELLWPFRARVLIHDPWLPDGAIRAGGAEPVALDALLSRLARDFRPRRRHRRERPSEGERPRRGIVSARCWSRDHQPFLGVLVA